MESWSRSRHAHAHRASEKFEKFSAPVALPSFTHPPNSTRDDWSISIVDCATLHVQRATLPTSAGAHQILSLAMIRATT